MFKQALADGVLPPTLTEAVITVIHKKGKELEEVSSFRLIFLLNQDGKLFSKILVNRLGPLLSKLVHSDQTSLYQIETLLSTLDASLTSFSLLCLFAK